MRLTPPRLDRIVRGRAWIPALGVLLVAIVGLRVEVLKLGSGVGRQIQQATLLQSSNSQLRSEISALSDNRRIESLAARYGMHMPSPLDVHFLQASAGTHLQAAIRHVTQPSGAAFLGGLAAEQRASQQNAQAIAAMNGAGAGAPTTVGGAAVPPVATGAGVPASPTAAAGGGSSAATPGATASAPPSAAGGASAPSANAGSAASAAGGASPGTGAGNATAASSPAGAAQGGSVNGGTGLAG